VSGRRASEHGLELGAAFREAMSLLATGVVMVTTRVDGRPWGLTISACCSVSANPPMLLVSLGEQTVSAREIRAQGGFGVSILSQHQLEAAKAGAAAGVPKFVEGYCADEVEPAAGSPVIRGATAHLDCRVEREVAVADHVLFIGEVADVVLSPGGTPLLYWARQYAELNLGEQWYS
jgi:flavin reductase (DIM6/NTAB) family NADH-FMN oxidoreductase RutF